MDIAKAAKYYHVVFQEAENAWAIIDREGYAAGEYREPGSTLTSYKVLECTAESNCVTVTITYNAWKTASDNMLTGSIRIVFSMNSYRMDNSANFYLEDFAINNQDVTGSGILRYRLVEDSENDHYAFVINSGAGGVATAAIHEAGHNMPQIISCAIANGQYERLEGNETLSMNDDLWAFHGTMTGRLRNDLNMNYTNTVSTVVTLVGGERVDGRLFFDMFCKIAQRGFSHVRIAERPDIYVQYRCSEVFFDSVAHIQ